MSRFSDWFNELRDPWALAMAEVTGGITYLVGAPIGIAFASAASVLVVRVAAGRRFPRIPDKPKKRLLTQYEEDIAKMISGGQPSEDIARQLKVTVDAIREIRERIYEKLGIEHRWELREWLLAEGVIRPVRPSLIRRIIESDPVRATLTAGGFIGLSWTLFQIYRTTCPGLQTLVPWLPLPPCPS